jgi:polyhydroxyalkanoate synthesis repressor PhaR
MTTTKKSAERLIKKYPNRRLYDTETSTYITLSDVKQLVLDQEEFKVMDAKSAEDLTRSILLQIILEEESGGLPMFSSVMLSQIIRFYGNAMQGMMGTYLEKNIQAFIDIQHKLTDQSKGLIDGNAVPLNPEVWSQFMNMQAPMMQGMMTSYIEQSKNMFVQMQEQMQTQAKSMFNTFPFPTPGTAGATRPGNGPTAATTAYQARLRRAARRRRSKLAGPAECPDEGPRHTGFVRARVSALCVDTPGRARKGDLRARLTPLWVQETCDGFWKAARVATRLLGRAIIGCKFERDVLPKAPSLGTVQYEHAGHQGYASAASSNRVVFARDRGDIHQVVNTDAETGIRGYSTAPRFSSPFLAQHVSIFRWSVDAFRIRAAPLTAARAPLRSLASRLSGAQTPPGTHIARPQHVLHHHARRSESRFCLARITVRSAKTA